MGGEILTIIIFWHPRGRLGSDNVLGPAFWWPAHERPLGNRDVGTSVPSHRSSARVLLSPGWNDGGHRDEGEQDNGASHLLLLADL